MNAIWNASTTVLVDLLLALSLATAQNGEGAALDLTLAEAQAEAERRAPGVRVAAARVREAEATRVGAGLRLPTNPRLQVDGRPGLARDVRDELGYAAQLDVTLDLSGAPGARHREADARVTATQADGAVVRLEARLAALASYVGVRLAELRMEQAREAIALGERLLGAARERLGAGAGSDIEVASAEVEVAERRAELFAATAARTRAEMELRQLLGIAAERPLRLTTGIDAPVAVAPTATLVTQAKGRRPELAAIDARLALLAASQERLRLEARPKVGVFAGVDASPASPMFGIAGLSLELPFAQRNQGPRAVVAAERQTELERRAVIEERFTLAVHAARGAYEARRAELEVLTQRGIPAAGQRLDLVETGWRAGRFDVFRLTTAAQDLVRLKSMRVAVLEGIWNERLLLERLLGGFGGP